MAVPVGRRQVGSHPLVSPSDSPVRLILDPVESALELCFSWREDRWNWQVQIAESQEILLQSLEGNSEDVWPPSPPIQQLMFEKRENTNVALGIGMAGASHWSIAIEPAKHSGIIVDNACLIKSRPDFLGSSFKYGDLENSDRQINSGLLNLSSNWQLHAGLDDQSNLQIDGNIIRVQIQNPLDPDTDDSTRSHRWVYQLSKRG